MKAKRASRESSLDASAYDPDRRERRKLPPFHKGGDWQRANDQTSVALRSGVPKVALSSPGAGLEEDFEVPAGLRNTHGNVISVTLPFLADRCGGVHNRFFQTVQTGRVPTKVVYVNGKYETVAMPGYLPCEAEGEPIIQPCGVLPANLGMGRPTEVDGEMFPAIIAAGVRYREGPGMRYGERREDLPDGDPRKTTERGYQVVRK